MHDGEIPSEKGLPSMATHVVVDWDGAQDPANPLNWPLRRKMLNGVLVSLMAFLTPLSSSVLAPGVPNLMAEFGSSSPELASFVVSVYILGFAAGPVVMAPLSEMYGRLAVYHGCNLGFLAFTAASAAAPGLAPLIAFRFLCGVFGSAPITNGGGSIADMASPAARGRALSAIIAGPMLGPVVGPVAGGFLVDAAGWRWACWLVLVVAGLVALLMLAFSDETYGPVLLARKTRRLQREARDRDNHDTLGPIYVSVADTNGGRSASAAAHFRVAILRPMRLLVLSPICTAFALYMAVVYGLLYIMFTSVTIVFEEVYGITTDLVGLVFLGMGTGSILGLGVFALLSDRYSARKDATMQPENRLWLLPYGAVCMPVGLFMYGWTVEYHVHWIVPIISHVFLAFGIVMALMCVSTYMIDCFTVYAASALAANTIIRSIGGAVLPLAGLRMYDVLGYGWGNSVLGFIALAMVLVPFLFIRWGEQLRVRFPVKNL